MHAAPVTISVCVKSSKLDAAVMYDICGMKACKIGRGDGLWDREGSKVGNFQAVFTLGGNEFKLRRHRISDFKTKYTWIIRKG